MFLSRSFFVTAQMLSPTTSELALSASNLDVLGYGRNLEGAGITRVQAEVVPKGTIQMQA
jgi:hypothetical protein